MTFKKTYLFIILCTALVCARAAAAGDTDIIRDYYSVFHPELLAGDSRFPAARAAAQGAAERPNGTLTLLRVVRSWNGLGDSARAELGRFFSETTVAGRAGERAAYQSTGSCSSILGTLAASRQSDHFIVYYTADSSLQDKVSATGANNTPDYISNILAHAEFIWNHEINVLGFTAPPLHSGKFPIYVCDIVGRRNLLGLTVTDEYLSGNSARSYIELDNDYVNVRLLNGLTVDGMIKVTLAHEFFHTIQFGLNWRYPSFWMLESTATWMEDEVYPDINDYVGEYLTERFSNMDVPIDHFSYSDTIAYGSSIFWKYVTEKAGGPGAMFQIWQLVKNDTQECNLPSCSSPGAYEITEIPQLQQYLATIGTNLDAVVRGYTTADYEKSYVDGALSYFPSVTPWAVPATAAGFLPLDHLSSHYYNLVPGSTASASQLTFNFTGSATGAWAPRLLLISNDGTVTQKDITTAAGAGSATVDGWGSIYSRAVAIISNTLITPAGDSSVYSFATSEAAPCAAVNTSPALAAGWNLVSFPLLPNFSSPFTAMGVNNNNVLFYGTAGQVFYTGNTPGFPGIGMPGHAYWLFMNAPAPVSLAGCALSAATADVSIKSGWNAVGDPFDTATPWADSNVTVAAEGGSGEFTLSQAVALGWLNGVLYSYSGGNYTANAHNSGASMAPWTGYWMEAKRNIILKLKKS